MTIFPFSTTAGGASLIASISPAPPQPIPYTVYYAETNPKNVDTLTGQFTGLEQVTVLDPPAQGDRIINNFVFQNTTNAPVFLSFAWEDNNIQIPMVTLELAPGDTFSSSGVRDSKGSFKSGQIGQTGDTGTDGKTPGIPMRWSTDTSSLAPGPGYIRGNVPSQGSITQLQINQTDRNNEDASPIYALLLKPNSVLQIQSVSDDQKVAWFTVNSFTINNNGLILANVSFINQINPFENNDLIALNLYRGSVTTVNNKTPNNLGNVSLGFLDVGAQKRLAHRADNSSFPLPGAADDGGILLCTYSGQKNIIIKSQNNEPWPENAQFLIINLDPNNNAVINPEVGLFVFPTGSIAIKPGKCAHAYRLGTDSWYISGGLV